MKKISIYAIIAFLSASVHAQTDTSAKQQKPQILTVSGDLQTFQVLLNALDKSDASHKEVKALQGWIVQQLTAQMGKKELPTKEKPKNP